MGYYRAGFTDITGVDIESMPRYPFEFVQSDALEYLEAHGAEFDLIHASPPCQLFSVQTKEKYRVNHQDYIAPTRAELKKLNKPFVIENVSGAIRELVSPIMLCGSMFNLRIFRHRFFEINPAFILLTPTCCHDFAPVYITGSTGNSKSTFRRRDALKRDKEIAIDIDWMVTRELDQAIPPAYTEWIGKQLIARLNGG